MEKKDIKDYLHLYLGVKCNVEGIEKYGWYMLSPTVLESAEKGDIKVKPMLRPLSSMTEEEAWEFVGGKSTLYDDVKISKLDKTGIEISYTIDAGEEGRYPQIHKIDFYAFTPKSFQWLLSKGFDIFNLIPEGLAIDSTLKPV